MPQVIHSTISGPDLHYSRMRTGSGDPNGVVTASIAGEGFFDEDTHNLWISTAANNSSWKLQGPSGTREFNCPSSVKVNDLVYPSADNFVSRAGKEVGLAQLAYGLVIKKPSVNSTLCTVTRAATFISGLSGLGLGGFQTQVFLGDSTDAINLTSTATEVNGELLQEAGVMFSSDVALISLSADGLVQ